MLYIKISLINGHKVDHKITYTGIVIFNIFKLQLTYNRFILSIYKSGFYSIIFIKPFPLVT